MENGMGRGDGLYITDINLVQSYNFSFPVREPVVPVGFVGVWVWVNDTNFVTSQRSIPYPSACSQRHFTVCETEAQDTGQKLAFFPG